MPQTDDRQYKISEVSDMVDVPVHVLRQWEARFPQLKPRRDSANRRHYEKADIAIVRRIKELLWHERMTTEGARVRLAQELRGEGRPRTRKEALEIIDKIEDEVRALLDLLESDED